MSKLEELHKRHVGSIKQTYLLVWIGAFLVLSIFIFLITWEINSPSGDLSPEMSEAGSSVENVLHINSPHKPLGQNAPSELMWLRYEQVFTIDNPGEYIIEGTAYLYEHYDRGLNIWLACGQTNGCNKLLINDPFPQATLGFNKIKEVETKSSKFTVDSTYVYPLTVVFRISANDGTIADIHKVSLKRTDNPSKEILLNNDFNQTYEAPIAKKQPNNWGGGTDNWSYRYGGMHLDYIEQSGRKRNLLFINSTPKTSKNENGEEVWTRYEKGVTITKKGKYNVVAEALIIKESGRGVTVQLHKPVNDPVIVLSMDADSRYPNTVLTYTSSEVELEPGQYTLRIFVEDGSEAFFDSATVMSVTNPVRPLPEENFDLETYSNSSWKTTQPLNWSAGNENWGYYHGNSTTTKDYEVPDLDCKDYGDWKCSTLTDLGLPTNKGDVKSYEKEYYLESGKMLEGIWLGNSGYYRQYTLNKAGSWEPLNITVGLRNGSNYVLSGSSENEVLAQAEVFLPDAPGNFGQSHQTVFVKSNGTQIGMYRDLPMLNNGTPDWSGNTFEGPFSYNSIPGFNQTTIQGIGMTLIKTNNRKEAIQEVWINNKAYQRLLKIGQDGYFVLPNDTWKEITLQQKGLPEGLGTVQESAFYFEPTSDQGGNLFEEIWINNVKYTKKTHLSPGSVEEIDVVISAMGTSAIDPRETANPGGYPLMKVYVNDGSSPVMSEYVTGLLKDYKYTFSGTEVSKVRVEFVNDYVSSTTTGVQDRNFRVDKITVDGIEIQTEDRFVYSKGSWSSENRCGPGFKKSEWLHCQGYFEWNIYHADKKCEQIGGEWIPEQCNKVKEDVCVEVGGIFDRCGSKCGYNPTGVCTTECYTCYLPNYLGSGSVPPPPPPLITQINDPEKRCNSIGGNWVRGQCTYVSKEACVGVGGVFNPCGSACGNQTGVNCPDVCVPTCYFSGGGPKVTPIETEEPRPTITRVPTVTSSSVNNHVISVYAKGTPVDGQYPVIQLLVNGNVVLPAKSVTKDLQEYKFTYSTDLIKWVRVHFPNDAWNRTEDRNLFVDKITVDGVTYQTEDERVSSIGSYSSTNQCGSGFKRSETLHCGGNFDWIFEKSADVCTQIRGNWSGTQCNNVDEDSCLYRGGVFDSCGSACNSTKGVNCPDICVETCYIKSFAN